MEICERNETRHRDKYWGSREYRTHAKGTTSTWLAPTNSSHSNGTYYLLIIVINIIITNYNDLLPYYFSC